MFHKRRVSVTGGFLLLTAWFAYANGVWITGVVLLAALTHEVGHFMMLQWAGGHVERVRIGILGAVMELKWTRFSYGRELLVLLAGPGANFLCAVLLISMGRETEAGANAILCAFNLLPISPLDGGRILELCLAWGLGPNTGEFVRHWVAAILALVLSLGIFYLIWCSRGSLWLIPAGVGLAGSGVREWYEARKYHNFL